MLHPNFPHLAVVFLDHFGTAWNIERAGGFFEDGDLRHRPGHGNDLLAPIVRHQKVSGSFQLDRMLRDLSQLEMRYPAVDADVANTIEQTPLFTVPTPTPQ